MKNNNAIKQEEILIAHDILKSMASKGGGVPVIGNTRTLTLKLDTNPNYCVCIDDRPFLYLLENGYVSLIGKNVYRISPVGESFLEQMRND